MIIAGYSSKYGQIYVERTGNTGFDADLHEPIALHRSQDQHSVAVMEFYLSRLRADPAVPPQQIASVERQLQLMREWRAEHPERVRTPGTRNAPRMLTVYLKDGTRLKVKASLDDFDQALREAALIRIETHDGQTIGIAPSSVALVKDAP